MCVHATSVQMTVTIVWCDDATQLIISNNNIIALFDGIVMDGFFVYLAIASIMESSVR